MKLNKNQVSELNFRHATKIGKICLIPREGTKDVHKVFLNGLLQEKGDDYFLTDEGVLMTEACRKDKVTIELANGEYYTVNLT